MDTDQQKLAVSRLWSERLEKVLLAPIRAMRLRYLPLLMVYFAYGALGLTGIAEAFWIKQALSMTPAQLAALSVWLTLPWTVKMVFGELVDTVPLFGSQRRAYVFVGASLIAAGLILLAGAAGGWIRGVSIETLYVLAQLLSVTGVVIQDVVADAMSTEVVPRANEDGTARSQADVDPDLGMVQVLGRLAPSMGLFCVAGLAAALGRVRPYVTELVL